jgi:hypothetical protein
MDQVDELLNRPALYDNIDGIGELSLGLMCLSFTLFGWWNLRTPEGSIWHTLYGLFIYVAMTLLAIHFGGRAIRNRVTYRRTGFVAYRRDKYWLPLATALCISAVVPAAICLVARQRWETTAPVALVVLVFALGYVRLARAVRWKWVVVSLMVAGAGVIAVLPMDVAESFANHAGLTPAIPAKLVGAFWLTVAVCGFVQIVSGAISFRLYLRNAPQPEQADR